jgi:hypothetical protein
MADGGLQVELDDPNKPAPAIGQLLAALGVVGKSRIP